MTDFESEVVGMVYVPFKALNKNLRILELERQGVFYLFSLWDKPKYPDVPYYDNYIV